MDSANLGHHHHHHHETHHHQQLQQQLVAPPPLSHLHLPSFSEVLSNNNTITSTTPWINPNFSLNHGINVDDQNSMQAAHHEVQTLIPPTHPNLHSSASNFITDQDALLHFSSITHHDHNNNNWAAANSDHNYSQYSKIKEECEDSLRNYYGFQVSAHDHGDQHSQSAAQISSTAHLWESQNVPASSAYYNCYQQGLSTSGNDQLIQRDILLNSIISKAEQNYMNRSSVSSTEFQKGCRFNSSTESSTQLYDSKKSSSSSTTTTTTSSNSSLSNYKTSEGAAAGERSKRPRNEATYSSFSPLKVRKEKLGDRISALQQLVAPFGKTDTASVLMEAIGYIKFLHNQLETLSVPYMKQQTNSNGISIRKTFGVCGKVGYPTGGEKRERSSEEYEGADVRDLRSRGLCLVPLSCMAHVANEETGNLCP